MVVERECESLVAELLRRSLRREVGDVAYVGLVLWKDLLRSKVDVGLEFVDWDER